MEQKADVPMTSLSWPNGKRVAVLVSVLLETWAEGKNPSYFPRTTALKPGTPDLPAKQWSEYGAEEGVWRILSILEKCGVPATVFSSAIAAELYPDLINQILKLGHHIAAHGYSQDQFLLDFTVEEQQATIRKCLDILAKATGRRPTGWGTPVYGGTKETPELLAREGIKWSADAANTSLPRLHHTPGGTIVALPWSDFVDNRVLRGNPRDFHDVYRDTFDYLYAHEPFSILQMGFHGHFGGRPLMSAQLHKVLQYMKSFPDVWFARHEDVVAWFISQKIEMVSPQQCFFGR